jgi:hypothetical protein
MPEFEKKREILLKLSGTQEDIFAFLNELPKTKYPADSLTLSKINKNEKDENYHLFININLNKPPPKEQTVEVKEVR